MSASGGFSFVKVSIDRLSSHALRGVRMFIADFTNGEFVRQARAEYVAESFDQPRVTVVDGLPPLELMGQACAAAEDGVEMVVLYKVPGAMQVMHLHQVRARRVLCEVAS